VEDATRNPCATKFHCVKCGTLWGKGLDIQSSGVCIECFAEWALTKIECFGKCYKIDCLNVCKFVYYCKEYYGIK